MARISVLLPVYNVQTYVADAVASIQSQTFTDIEIVIVDDGSTDGTRRIVEQIATTDQRIRIECTGKNQGLVSALNYGLQFCTAPYIARMDGDDIALPTRLEKQLAFLEDHSNISLVGCTCLPIDEEGNPTRESTSPAPVTHEEILKTMLFASPCSHPSWLSRTETYERLSGYREIPASEDFDFLLRAVTSGFRLANLPEPLIRLRTRRDQISGSVKQRRAHDYVVRLYRQRVKNGTDTFNPDDCEQATKSRKIEERRFHFAQRCNAKGIQSGGRFSRLFFAALSAFLSPWQRHYFLSRRRFQIAKRTATFRGKTRSRRSDVPKRCDPSKDEAHRTEIISPPQMLKDEKE